MPFKSKAQLADEAQALLDTPVTPGKSLNAPSTHKQYTVVPFLSPESAEAALNLLPNDYEFLFVVPSNGPHTNGYAVFVREVVDGA